MRYLPLLLPLVITLPASASVFIEPIYSYPQQWSGKARVRIHDDGKQSVVVKYPVFEGCMEATDYIESAKAGNPGANRPFGIAKVMKMTTAEVNRYIRRFENSVPIGSEPSASYRPKFTLVKYPSQPFDCGPNPITRPFPGWR